MKVPRRYTTTKERQRRRDEPGPMPWTRHLFMAIVGLFLASLVAGYLFAALYLFPAPFIVRNRTVPRVIGETGEEAQSRLLAAGFTGEVIESVDHPSVAAGSVIWQDPPPSTEAPQGTTINLTVSSGPGRIQLPDVLGFDQEVATRLVEAAGLRVSRIEHTQTAEPRGVAVNTRPTPGSFLPPASGVTLVVSEGAPTIRVPDLTGLRPDSARAVLDEAGLRLGTTIRRTAPGQEGGTIFRQSPAPGTLSAPGTPINVDIVRELNR